MLRVIKYSILLLLFTLMGCLPNIKNAVKNSNVVVMPTLAVNTTSATTWIGLCIKHTVRFNDDQGNYLPLPMGVTLDITTIAGVVYSGSDCETTAITSLDVPAGSTVATI